MLKYTQHNISNSFLIQNKFKHADDSNINNDQVNNVTITIITNNTDYNA